MTRARTSIRKRLLLLAAAFVFAVGLGEVLLRLLWRETKPGELFYQDADRKEADALPEAIRRGIAIPVDPAENPRVRYRWAPDSTFYMCYRDHQRLRLDWVDDQGCVEVRTNHWGLRERDDLTPDNKAPDEKRIVCVGDSFTFGWGVPVEKGWVRLLEDELRTNGRNVRTVNCGAAGALFADEYWWAFQHRFSAFQPDAVIVTLCLNDLLPCHGLCLLAPPPRKSGLMLYDRARALLGPGPLDLDPTIDWVDLLLNLPKDQLAAAGLVADHVQPHEALWSQQAPQQALRQFRAWCGERNLPFLVVVWPFFQGLGDGVPYPFGKIHELVVQFCRSESIPCLDLLPVFRKQRAEHWWVTPADMHANPAAHAAASVDINGFVKRVCGW